MIENLQSLWTDPGYPSLHVVVIHFPIALLALAPFFDIGCLVFRSRVWLDRTAAALYMIGTIGAGAAYLTGERAAAVSPLGSFASRRFRSPLPASSCSRSPQTGAGGWSINMGWASAHRTLER